MDAIQQIEVDSSIEVASMFRVRIGIVQVSRDSGSDWSILARDLFTPLKPVTLRVNLDAGTAVTLINGYVSGLDVSFADEPGGSNLEVVGMDATLLMNLEERIGSWSNLSDSDIATRVLDGYAQHSIRPEVHPVASSLTDPEGTPTQRATDIRFLRRLAQRNGFECHVQPDGKSGSDTAYFGPPRLSAGYQAVLTVAGGAVSNVSGFAVRYDMLRPTTATASALDVLTKSTQPVTVASVALDRLGELDTLGRIRPAPLVRPAQTGLMHSADLGAMAQGLVDRCSWALVAEGLVGPDVGVLRPGLPLNVRGAGLLLSGSYYVTRVTHTLGGVEGYVQRFRAQRNALGSTRKEGYQEDGQNVA
jgi:hypothetical protein